MSADEASGGACHGVAVKPAHHLPGAASLQRQRRVAEEFKAAETGRNGAVNGGMDNLLEISPRDRIGKDDPAQGFAIDGTRRVEHGRAEPVRDRGGRLGTRRRHAVRQFVDFQTGARNGATDATASTAPRMTVRVFIGR